MRILIAAGALSGCLLAAPVFAADYDFVLTNSTDSQVVGVHPQFGKVIGFKPVAANGERSFTISMPEGVCETRIQFIFADAEPTSIEGYDACNSGGIDLSY